MENTSKKITEELNKYKFLYDSLKAIIDSSYDGIFVTDGEANVLMLNKAYERITGIDAEYVIGKNMAQLVEEGYYNQSGSLEVIRTGKQVTLRQKLISGKEILVTSTPVYNKNGKREFIVTNVRDISDLVKLKEKLSLTEALYQKYRSELENIKEQMMQHPGFVVKDKRTVQLVRTLLKVAKFDTTILLTGESGVGKTMAAKFIHDNSSRKDYTFIEVNCGSIPPTLIESELFGYESGAFTGASKKGKIGVFELAHNSTLFLDEISEARLDIQVSLLKAIDEGIIKPVGGDKAKKVNVRIIAATNKNLEDLVKKGLFREDLYYRLNVIPIEIPPLRERKDDITDLCINFLNDFNKKYGSNKYFTVSALEALKEYHWPGNVRELKNLVEHLIIITHDDKIDVMNLPSYIFKNKKGSRDAQEEDFIAKFLGMGLNKAMEVFEKKMIDAAIAKCGNKKRAAELLKVHPSTITRKSRG